MIVAVMLGSFVVVGHLSTQIMEATVISQVESNTESESNETIELADELVDAFITHNPTSLRKQADGNSLQFHYISYLLISDTPPPERI